jgi:hypothetical protein
VVCAERGCHLPNADCTHDCYGFTNLFAIEMRGPGSDCDRYEIAPDGLALDTEQARADVGDTRHRRADRVRGAITRRKLVDGLVSVSQCRPGWRESITRQPVWSDGPSASPYGAANRLSPSMSQCTGQPGRPATVPWTRTSAGAAAGPGEPAAGSTAVPRDASDKVEYRRFLRARAGTRVAC